MTSEQFTSSNYDPSATVPQSVSVNLDQLPEVGTKIPYYSIFIWVTGVLLICGSLGLIIGLISPIFSLQNQTTTTIKTTMNFTTFVSTTTTKMNTVATSISSSVTTLGTSTGVTGGTGGSTTQATTTVTCPSGYSRSPSNVCVNLLIDFYNCGSFGYVCSSNYTSCSYGVCSGVPGVTLVGGVPVANWGGNISADDLSTILHLPLSLTLYNYSSSNVSISTNGIICLGSCSTAYTNGYLPDSSFTGPTAFGYWDDLMIYSGTSQSIYYNVVGTAPNRTTTFEFYESHYGLPTQYCHFQIQFYENLPGIVKFIYFQATDTGSSATIGVQSSPTGPYMTYSVNQVNSVTTNLVLTFNTNTGTFAG